MDRSKCTMFGVDGRRIFMIVGNSHGALDELIMLDMQIPEEAFLSESVLVRIVHYPSLVFAVSSNRDESSRGSSRAGALPCMPVVARCGRRALVGKNKYIAERRARERWRAPYVHRLRDRMHPLGHCRCARR